MYFVNDDYGWAAGPPGVLLATKDGGNTWYLRPITGFAGQITGFYFLDRQRGWFSSSDYDQSRRHFIGGALYRTRDGGDTWIRELNVSQNNSGILGILFVTPEQGWAFGSAVWETQDGGGTWSQREDLGGGLWALTFVDASHGWLHQSRQGQMRRTSDGGKTWADMPQTPDSFQDVFFIDAVTGWAIAARRVYSTNDGGSTWQLQWDGSQVVGDAVLTKMRFVDRNRGWAIWGNAVLRTINGGTSWVVQTQAGELADIYLGTNTWLLLSSQQPNFYRSADGGKTWNPTAFAQPPKNLRPRASQFCFGTSPCWRVGIGGAIEATKDGKVWTRQVSGVLATLFDVYFDNPNEGWVGGDQGVVLHTVDGGANWELQDSRTPGKVINVHFASPKVGAALAEPGTLLLTTDGGTAWQRYDFAKHPDLFPDAAMLVVEPSGAVWLRLRSSLGVYPSVSVFWGDPKFPPAGQWNLKASRTQQ